MDKRWTITVLPLFCKTGIFVGNAHVVSSQMLTPNPSDTGDSNTVPLVELGCIFWRSFGWSGLKVVPEDLR